MDKKSSKIKSRAKQLNQILSKIGQAKLPEDMAEAHTLYNFEDPYNPTFFCVELNLALKSAEGLANLINETLIKDNVPATVRMIGIDREGYKHGNEMAHYTFEIIPQENAPHPPNLLIPSAQSKEDSQKLKKTAIMEYATIEGLTKLPKVIRDLHMKGTLDNVLYNPEQV